MAEAAPARTPEDTRSVKALPCNNRNRKFSNRSDSNQTPLLSPVLNEAKPDNSTNSTATTAFRQP